ncbi:transcription factor CYCLOIDEA-like [Lycium ferocissimum]|uniref:transcription factor CYCLOIDEA-like n=1 Tax=Lycium ferocissimum TaxID=112874 RepID=UPI0028154A2E|nr:transcription factor CYCLOIDEA-like [Lycium ferocissimum]
MFPASNSSTGNPVPQYTSSSFHSSSPFLGLNGNQILLHQYYQNQFSSHYLAKNTGFSANNIINCPNNNQDHCDNSFRSFPIKKKIKKKERCSKILTAQGPRDRRVRLSIGIARKFFDLQEMLGFDKPSKTMDWLFTNSKLAIEELTNWLTLRDHQSKISGSIPNPINSLRSRSLNSSTTMNLIRLSLRSAPSNLVSPVLLCLKLELQNQVTKISSPRSHLRSKRMLENFFSLRHHHPRYNA